MDQIEEMLQIIAQKDSEIAALRRDLHKAEAQARAAENAMNLMFGTIKKASTQADAHHFVWRAESNQRT